eukprot:gene11080-biopygen11087
MPGGEVPPFAISPCFPGSFLEGSWEHPGSFQEVSRVAEAISAKQGSSMDTSWKLPGSLLFDRSDLVSDPLRFPRIWNLAHTWKLPGRMQVTCFLPGWRVGLSYQETSRKAILEGCCPPGNFQAKMACLGKHQYFGGHRKPLALYAAHPQRPPNAAQLVGQLCDDVDGREGDSDVAVPEAWGMPARCLLQKIARRARAGGGGGPAAPFRNLGRTRGLGSWAAGEPGYGSVAVRGPSCLLWIPVRNRVRFLRRRAREAFVSCSRTRRLEAPPPAPAPTTCSA